MNNDELKAVLEEGLMWESKCTATSLHVVGCKLTQSLIMLMLIKLNNIVLYRHEDLKQMLDSNKDSLKLEAMKRIIGVSSEFKHILFKLYCILLQSKC
jgi:predicted metal-dependent hydrolase